MTNRDRSNDDNWLNRLRNWFQAQLTGSGAIAQGEGAKAVGERGVITEGPVGGDIVTGTKITTIHQAAPGPDRAALRAAYLNHVFETTGRLSLAGVDPKAASNEAEARLNLGAVYTALLTLSPEANERLLRGESPEREVRRLPALAQLNEQPRLVLLGDPGSGKSTFVNFVAMCLAGEALNQPQANLARLTAPLPDDEGKDEEERQPWQRGALLPVRVILRDFAARGLPEAGRKAAAKHLWDFIAAELEAAGLADYAPHLREELLKQGGLLLLDGLDEVPEAHQRRLQLRQTVEDFAAAFPRCRLLVTSRTYAYQKQEWCLPGFAEAVLAPFSDGQIRRFVDRWYAHIAELRGLHADDAQGRAETLKRAIFGSGRLRALAERPLLLTLMASLHAWRGGTLPEKREELYNDTVDLLLDWWESPKTVRNAQGQLEIAQPSLAEWLKVDRARVRALLNETAFNAHAEQAGLTGTADVDEGRLVSGLMRLSQNPDVNPARLMEYLSQRAGLLLPRGVGVYTFPHRTFQEYLAACYLTDHDYPDLVAGLARQEPNRWREVALLAGAKAARGSAFAVWALVEALCYTEAGSGKSDPADLWGAHLAGQALVETANLEQVSERNQPKVERVRNWQVHLLAGGELPAVDRATAGDTLAQLGDPREAVTMLDQMEFCLVPAGPFWMGSPDDDKMAQDDEKPLHQVDIPYDYWIGRYPITTAQFRTFVAASGYRPGDKDSLDVRANHPVIWVSWHETIAFCDWLTQDWRARRLLPAAWQVTLPSEAEWEKGARGGLHIPAAPVIIRLGEATPVYNRRENPEPQRRYPWGKDPDSNRANYGDTGLGWTSAVGCFPGGVTPYGCEEMSGNVFEWCRTKWEDSYKDYRDDNNLEGDEARVLRGGSWLSDVNFARCAVRSYALPSNRLDDFGFRVCVAPI